MDNDDRLLILAALAALESSLWEEFCRYRREAEDAKRAGDPVPEAIEILQGSVTDRLRGVVDLRRRLLATRYREERNEGR